MTNTTEQNLIEATDTIVKLRAEIERLQNLLHVDQLTKQEMAHTGKQAIQERDALRAENERLRAACALALDFHAADTHVFVERHGHGMTTRDLCDRVRAALGSDKRA